MMHALRYTLWLLGQVFVGAIAIAKDVFRRESQMDPVVVAYPLRVESDFLITAFSTSITMTPGTLSLGFRKPRFAGEPRMLLVQAVFGSDPDEVMAELADMEERLAPSIGAIDYGAPGQGPGQGRGPGEAGLLPQKKPTDSQPGVASPSSSAGRSDNGKAGEAQ